MECKEEKLLPLKNENRTSPFIQNCTAIFLLCFIIIALYSNSFDCSWHLDDYHNIVRNSKIHISDLEPSSLYKAFFAKPGKRNTLYRPVPMLTFAVNWYAGNGKVWGFHFVNVSIHLINAIFLYLSISALLQTPAIDNKTKENAYFVALFASAFWAINPIHVNTVTYIVQRMAAMAAMFYISGIYFYLKGKLEPVKLKKGLFFTACFLSFLLGMGSKENAVLMPISIILIEFIFFKRIESVAQKKHFIIATAVVSISIGLLGALVFLKNSNPLSFLSWYDKRPFTLIERLMTEPRVVIYYLTQIFYPTPDRFSIDHIVSISKNLITPWTTLPSIFVIFAAVFISIKKMAQWPILSFSILFFFINHLIESSIIGLELVFEHRNYLPSFFLFLPVAVGINRLLNNYKNKKSYLYVSISIFISLLIAAIGMGTYIVNMDWKTEKALWSKALTKYPDSGRAAHNLAWGYYKKIGKVDTALSIYEKALSLKGHTKHHTIFTLNNMAVIHMERGQYSTAEDLWNRAIKKYPKFRSAKRRLVQALIAQGKLIDASQMLDDLLEEKETAELLNTRGFLFLKQQKYLDAISFYRRSLKLKPWDKIAMVNMGTAFNRIGKYERANWFLLLVHEKQPQSTVILLSLIENAIQSKKLDDADRYLDKLIRLKELKKIVAIMRPKPTEQYLPLSDKIILPYLISKFKNKINRQNEYIEKLGAKL